MENRIFATSPGPGPKGTILTEILFLLRFIQQSTLSITLFISLYFVYWHITLIDSIPTGLLILIFTTITTLTLSQLAHLSHTLFPTTSSLLPLKTTLTSSILLTIGYGSLYTSLHLSGADDWFKPIRESKGYSSLAPAGVEEHHAVLGRCLSVIGGVGLLTTIFISVLAVKEKGWKPSLSMNMPKMGRGNNGYVAVGEEEGYEFDEEETICAEEGGLKSS